MSQRLVTVVLWRGRLELPWKSPWNFASKMPGSRAEGLPALACSLRVAQATQVPPEVS